MSSIVDAILSHTAPEEAVNNTFQKSVADGLMWGWKINDIATAERFNQNQMALISMIMAVYKASEANDASTVDEVKTLIKSVNDINSVAIISAYDPDPSVLARKGQLYLNESTGELFSCIYSGATSKKTRWVGNRGTLVGASSGNMLIVDVGSTDWIVPTGVSFISAVLVGGGGGGAHAWSQAGGSGGALAYANVIPVKEGDTVTVTVGMGGFPTKNGGDTVIKVNGVIQFTAKGGKYAANSEANRAKPVSGAISCKGGAGGLVSGSWQGGGGGAGGYGDASDGMDACGGDGIYGSPVSGYGSYGASGAGASGYSGNGSKGAGSGGTGYQSSTYGFGGGGGVGLYGRGISGNIKPGNGGNAFYNRGIYGGTGGSGGQDGAGNTNGSESMSKPQGWTGEMTMYHGCGGMFGGGGAGSGSSQTNNANFGRGGNGGARIVWGTKVDWSTSVPEIRTTEGVV